MPAAKQHSLTFTKEEYGHFRAYLKTQVIMKEDQVFGFIIDDMILEDRGDVLRFKLAYMPPWMRRLDVYVERAADSVQLSWNAPTFPKWHYAIMAAVLLFLTARIPRTPDFKLEDLAPLLVVAIPGALTTFVYHDHLREGAERFKAAMQSISDRAKHYAEEDARRGTDERREKIAKD